MALSSLMVVAASHERQARSGGRVKNIVLTGFMGAGKSAVARILSQQLGYVLVDVDCELERERQMTITEMFKQYGEAAFRDMESAMIKKLSEMDRAVIATGGGAVLRQENRDNLRRKGIIVCLTASAETIYRRTGKDSNRPLLQVDDPLGKIREMLASRKPYYEMADIMVDTEGKTPAEVAGEIIKKTRAKIRD